VLENIERIDIQNFKLTVPGRKGVKKSFNRRVFLGNIIIKNFDILFSLYNYEGTDILYTST
jgi:hypothetical protein